MPLPKGLQRKYFVSPAVPSSAFLKHPNSCLSPSGQSCCLLSERCRVHAPGSSTELRSLPVPCMTMCLSSLPACICAPGANTDCRPPDDAVFDIITDEELCQIQELWVWSLGQEDLLEKEMATHSSILAWKSPWTEESGRLQSMGSRRVGHE